MLVFFFRKIWRYFGYSFFVFRFDRVIKVKVFVWMFERMLEENGYFLVLVLGEVS